MIKNEEVPVHLLSGELSFVLIVLLCSIFLGKRRVFKFYFNIALEICKIVH